MKFNLFTFLKENKILVVVKTKMLKVKEKLQDKASLYIQEKSPEAKDKLVNFILAQINK